MFDWLGRQGPWDTVTVTAHVLKAAAVTVEARTRLEANLEALNLSSRMPVWVDLINKGTSEKKASASAMVITGHDSAFQSPKWATRRLSFRRSWFAERVDRETNLEAKRGGINVTRFELRSHCSLCHICTQRQAHNSHELTASCCQR